VWNNASNRHANAEPDVAVTYDDVLGALCILAITSRVLDGHSIIIISDIQALNDDIFATRI